MPAYQIISGDCLDYLKGCKDGQFDICLTDPPYGVKRDSGFGGADGFAGHGRPIPRRQYDDDWDGERPDKIYFDHILRVAKTVLIFGGNYFADLLPPSTHWIVWDKINTMPTFGDCELIWTNLARKSVKKIVYQYNGLIGKEQKRYHPTQKPVGLLTQLLAQYAQPGDTVLDPYMGSGSSGVAALQLGMRFVGCEKLQKYCKIAEKRLSVTGAQVIMPLPPAQQKTTIQQQLW